MKKIAFYNNKGGVGKTTTVINIAYTLSKLGHSVLVVDCDSQQNSSRFFLSESYDGNLLSLAGVGIESVLTGKSNSLPPFQTRYTDIGVKISSSTSIIGEFEQLSPEEQQTNVSRLLNEAGFDYILLDMPPAMSVVNERLIRACDSVIVPIELGTFALQGIATVTATINRIGASFGGCFVSKFDKNNPVDNDLLAILQKSLGAKAFQTVIPFSRVIKNSISYKLTAHEYMAWEEAAEKYVQLTNEIINKA